MEKNSGKWEIGFFENQIAYGSLLVKFLNSGLPANKIKSWRSIEALERSRSLGDLDVIFIDDFFRTGMASHIAGEIKQRIPEVEIVLITNDESNKVSFKSLNAESPASTKQYEMAGMNNLIPEILEGKTVIVDTSKAQDLSGSFKRSKMINEPRLTIREIEIINLLIQGRTASAASDDIQISVNTLRTHIKKIYKKMKVKNRVELMTKAMELGIV